MTWHQGPWHIHSTCYQCVMPHMNASWPWCLHCMWCSCLLAACFMCLDDSFMSLCAWMTHSCATWPIYVWYDSFKCDVTRSWLIDVRRNSFMTHLWVTWLIETRASDVYTCWHVNTSHVTCQYIICHMTRPRDVDGCLHVNKPCR